MKKEVPGGIGCFLVCMLNSDILLGLAETSPSIPSKKIFNLLLFINLPRES